MTVGIQKAFEAIGARALVETRGNVFEIDVLREQRRKGVKHRRYRRQTAAYVRQGGKPHHVEWLYRVPGDAQVFARGAVSHPDHTTIVLGEWHLVLQNQEAKPTPVARPFTRMTFVD